MIVGIRQAHQTPLFRRRKRLSRRPHRVALPAAHLDESQQVALLGDDIDLTLPYPKVPLPNAVALREQVLDRKPLPQITERLTRVLLLNPQL